MRLAQPEWEIQAAALNKKSPLRFREVIFASVVKRPYSGAASGSAGCSSSGAVTTTVMPMRTLASGVKET